jgi:hypothetical protein
MSIDQNSTRGRSRRRIAGSTGAVIVFATMGLGMGGRAGATAPTQESTAAEQEEERIVAATLAPIGVTILPADFPRGFEPPTAELTVSSGGAATQRADDLNVMFSKLPTSVQTAILLYGDLGGTAALLAANGR